jgi:hypothetical protein
MMVYPYTTWILAKAVIDGSTLFFRPCIVLFSAVLILFALRLVPIGQLQLRSSFRA